MNDIGPSVAESSTSVVSEHPTSEASELGSCITSTAASLDGSFIERSVSPRGSYTGAQGVVAGRPGCWTCGIRRQKCDRDQEEAGEEATCRTCDRFGLRCLGFSTHRPDWTRDKEKVAAFKAEVRARLVQSGFVRGAPQSRIPSLHVPPEFV
ncbi:hypothetical protein BC629DRAFT_295759 [Irpex lacteus]|nr:hypothetical protein BC629DRAFT_295759 [Irpex lacteus]